MTILTAASATLWPAKGALKVPENQRVHSIKLWCEFGVFGLSIYDDQTPWFTLIELLQIASYRNDANEYIFPGLARDPVTGLPEHEKMSYDIPNNTTLRHLLFRDREMARLATMPTTEPSVLWDRWLAHAEREFQGLSFGYLKSRFEEDFKQMAEAVELLRSAEVEKFGTRRWTSRHLMPLGRSMIFPDVKQDTSGEFLLDRRFFQRTGELLYLMLNRSGRRAEVERLLKARVLTSDSPLDRLARRLRPEWDEGKAVSSNIGYLPAPEMAVYDRLAEDWAAVLGLGSLPMEDCLDALMRLSGLHEVIYIIERAADEAGRPSVPPFVLDLAGTARSNPVFASATESYKTHRALPIRAIEAYVERFAASDEWLTLGNGPAAPENAKTLLHKRFLWVSSATSNTKLLDSPSAQMDRMLEATRDRNHDVGSALTAHARRIGLLAAQRRSGTWYSPTDGLLEALVLANVTGPMEFGAFLKLIHRRYYIVVGPEEARASDGSLPAPLAALKRNEQRLEERLRVLGFIDRKSDDCAFVINPFYRR
ncbi:hypothetical protein [Azospirillum argentinense]|uniref:Uncharacterized protein n=1 Tax=Azospirillum brasilense TaxID=192 RepID=A0A4D8PZ81_AZOBR|nr:hypothetical protein [Azospirillum argentinense]QCO02851.1 hypothetical protein D3867_13030 [Azospirillum argentinense]